MNQRQFFLLFFVPAFAFIFFWAFYPMYEVIYLAFCNLDFRFGSSMKFIGLKNFIDLFNDYRFYNALKNSLAWLGLTVSGSLLIGIMLASIVHEYAGSKLRSLSLLAFIVPSMLPSIAAAYMWRLMYQPNVGIIPWLLNSIGIPGQINLLANSSTAFGAVAVINIWQWGSLLAALIIILFETVPKEAIEAGRLFGAGGWRLYRYVIIPEVIPGLIGLIFINMVVSLRSFDYIYVMTMGGPGIATETIDLYAYWQAVGSAGKASYASCMSIIMMLITLVIMMVFWRVVSPKRPEE